MHKLLTRITNHVKSLWTTPTKLINTTRNILRFFDIEHCIGENREILRSLDCKPILVLKPAEDPLHVEIDYNTDLCVDSVNGVRLFEPECKWAGTPLQSPDLEILYIVDPSVAFAYLRRLNRKDMAVVENPVYCPETSALIGWKRLCLVNGSFRTENI